MIDQVTFNAASTNLPLVDEKSYFRRILLTNIRGDFHLDYYLKTHTIPEKPLPRKPRKTQSTANILSGKHEISEH